MAWRHLSLGSKELLRQCDNVLPGQGPVRSPRDDLAALVAAMDGSEDRDPYGRGEFLTAFEADLAARFGKDAAVFMPSGTMAQQIALRIWCERRRDFTVAKHPSAHLELAEHCGHQFLHGIHRLQFGAAEFIGDRPFHVRDLDGHRKVPGATLLELPCRSLGGRLPSWDDVVAISDWARVREVPLHLDGARVWACADAWGRSLAEIAALFDSLYVSFYKDIGALCGAALIGPADVIAEARVRQRRHGGNLYTQAPFVTSAQQRLERVLPRLPAWNARARELATIFAAHPMVRVHPDPLHVNFFEVHLDVSAQAAGWSLIGRHHELAAQTGTFLFSGLRPSVTPGFLRTEVHCFENAAVFDATRRAPFLDALFA